jgi:hypothetical protein
LQFQANEASSNWIEIDFDPERSAARACEFFGAIEISTQPMTLREVFLTLARSNHPLNPGEAPQ